MKPSFRTLQLSLLSAAMSATLLPWPVFAMENESNADNHPTEQTETVYAFINESGKPEKMVVSGWIHDEDGIQNIKEDLDLTNVQNVKSDEQPAISGKQVTWNTDGTDVYFQGDADVSKKLPVTLNIRYELDGKEISPDQLAGKSGHLKMIFDFSNNLSKTVTIDGKSIVVHPLYAAGGFLNLNEEIFSNVHCQNSKTVNDGDKEMLVFAALPGLYQTMSDAGLQEQADKLHVSDSVVVEADVQNFEMPDFYAGITSEDNLKEIAQMDDLTSLTAQLDTLFAGADALEDGADQLANGTSQLKDGIAPLEAAGPQLGLLQQGTVALADGAGMLAKGITAYTNGTSTLQAGTGQLYEINDGISALQSAMNEKGSLKDGAMELSGGLHQLNQEVSAIHPEEMIGKYQKQIDDTLAQVTGLSDTMDKDLAVMDGLSSSLAQALSQSEQLKGALTASAAKVMESAGILSANVQAANGVIASDNEKIAAFNANTQAHKDQASAQISTALQSIEGQKGQIAALQASLDALKAKYPDDPDVQALMAASSLDAATAALNTAAGEISAIGSDAGLEAVPGLDANALSSLQESLNQIGSLLGQLQSMASMLDQAKTAMNGLKADLDAATGALNGMKEELAGIAASDDLGAIAGKLETLKAATAQLDAGAAQLSKGIEQVDGSLTLINDESKKAFDQVNTGLATLTSNNQALNDGAKTLEEGTKELADKSGQLDTLKSGMTELTSAVDALNSGAQTLADGTRQFNEQGMGALKEVSALSSKALSTLDAIEKAQEDLAKETRTFAGAPENAESSVRYILKFND